jgi:hypothetical protein
MLVESSQAPVSPLIRWRWAVHVILFGSLISIHQEVLNESGIVVALQADVVDAIGTKKAKDREHEVVAVARVAKTVAQQDQAFSQCLGVDPQRL